MASNQDLYRNCTDEKFVFYVAHDIFIRHFWNDQLCEHEITRSENHSEDSLATSPSESRAKLLIFSKTEHLNNLLNDTETLPLQIN